MGLLGESGCGKSTTAISMLGLLPSSAYIAGGSIQFRGRELLGLKERELESIRGSQISLVLQESGIALNPVLRVGDQVAEVMRAHRSWNKKRSREEAECMLRKVRLADAQRIYSSYPHQLSGGERQRVLIAQALACNPELVIADEPTASLDTTIQGEILALIKELKETLHISFLFITHNPAILQIMADRILVMYAGRIVEEGSAAEIFRNPLHPYTKALLECLPHPPSENGTRKKIYAAIAGSPPDMARLAEGCSFESRCRQRMDLCTTQEPREVQPEVSRRVRCFLYGG